MSDAPNEGIEENTELQSLIIKLFPPLECGEDSNIEELYNRATDIEKENASLRDQLSIVKAEVDGKDIIIGRLNDQLSKEREKVGELENEVKRLEGLLIEDEKIMTSDSGELQKEREMRKELVEELLVLSLQDFLSDPYIIEIEKLIVKASELDKNKT